VLFSPDIDAVAVVTPVWTHFELAQAVLQNEKHVFVEKPFTSTSAQSERAHVGEHEDCAYMTIYYSDRMIAHINVNWFSPVKVRTTLIGGEKKLLVWNDLEADEKIKLYDKGVDFNNGQSVCELLVSYRSGDM
jgi:predicted dehydrogenase